MKGKYRLFGKIPVVDILVVLLAVALLSAAVWLLTRQEVSEQTGSQAQAEQAYPFTAVLLAKDLTEEYAALPVVGEEIYLAGGQKLGKITKIERKPYGEYRHSPTDGKHVYTEFKDRTSLLISIEGEATASSPKGIFVGKKRIAYAQVMSVGNEKYCWDIFVADVGEVSK